jgi:hypothetical protein
MTACLLVVRYRFNPAEGRFRRAGAQAAPLIAAAPGLAWKLWGLDDAEGTGLSAYLFDSVEAARVFAQGPVPAALRANPDVRDVELTIAPIDAGLSALTGAAAALGLAAESPA